MFAIIETKKGTLVIIDESEASRFEGELSSDLLAMLAVCLPRQYGSSQQCWEPIDGVRTA